jgi:hypothetical protein
LNMCHQQSSRNALPEHPPTRSRVRRRVSPGVEVVAADFTRRQTASRVIQAAIGVPARPNSRCWTVRAISMSLRERRACAPCWSIVSRGERCPTASRRRSVAPRRIAWTARSTRSPRRHHHHRAR